MGKHRLGPFREARICDCGDHGFVGLNRGLCALYSSEDHEEIGVGNWSGLFCDGGPYARRNHKGKNSLMHRQILGVLDNNGIVVDHTNHDTLDNRRANLRICTRAQNLQNQRGARRAFPKGVYRKKSGAFYSQICANGVRKSFGPFETAEEAASAYQSASTRMHGEFGCTKLFPARRA